MRIEGTSALVTDVTSTERSQTAIAAAQEAGPLRAVVHCTGIGNPIRMVGRDGTPGGLPGFEQAIGVNLIGSCNALRLGAAAMAANEPVDGETVRLDGTIRVAPR
ncbi:hypothetical protein SAMN04489712_12262 [Thermomonospora echinospora]|uniref:Short chain dehydrogenase n=1 Tax=Thermomonospora echinospora TaxID=1992 RepID=A0A1H6DTJ5_9ACTN|nr:hypothetical protein [Thermomonospora echinospora]SEG88702.1 hypothetical protein SAMN04489712_12262 [Thermomonospora echinospora]